MSKNWRYVPYSAILTDCQTTTVLSYFRSRRSRESFAQPRRPCQSQPALCHHRNDFCSPNVGHDHFFSSVHNPSGLLTPHTSRNAPSTYNTYSRPLVVCMAIENLLSDSVVVKSTLLSWSRKATEYQARFTRFSDTTLPLRKNTTARLLARI